MTDTKPSSKDLLIGVLQPHIELASDIMKMVKSHNTNDPTHRFQVAAIIIFLAGIDKTLSLALELLYLAGEVDWNWMVKDKKNKPPTGYIVCERGFKRKIEKLEELGLDLKYMQELAELRNEYIHSCNIYVGYAEGLDEVEGEVRLRPTGPFISTILPPVTSFQTSEIHYYFEQLVEEIGSIIDQYDWQREWFRLADNVNRLPQNPEPEYSQFLNDPERQPEILEALNLRFVGDGAKHLRG